MKNSWLPLYFLLFSCVLILNINSCGDDSNIKSYEGGNNTPQDNSITQNSSNSSLSETGITYTQEAPFVEETIDEIKERESKKPVTIPEQRVIPFQKMCCGLQEEIEVIFIIFVLIFTFNFDTLIKKRKTT